MPLRRKMGKIGKTRRQIRRENRGWSFSSSSSPRPQARPTRRNSSPRHIENYVPFQRKTTTSSSHSAWRTVSSRGRGHKSLKTRKSRK